MQHGFGVFDHAALHGATLINGNGSILVRDGEFIDLKALQA